LNKIVKYADAYGIMHDTPQRHYFALIDGIVGGEGEGPMAPDPKPCGVLISGCDPVCIDAVMATLMGFDFQKIPSINQGFTVQSNSYPLTDIEPENIVLVANSNVWNKGIFAFRKSDTLRYRPHFGWQGHIELDA
jgi:uncharacterized protein (DUF362 family)